MSKHHKKLVREGDYVAEVEVALIESEEGWSPSLSLEDAQKLDAVREALRRGDLTEARRVASVYHLTPGFSLMSGWRRPRLTQLVFAFQYQREAEKFFRVLPKRLGRFGLELSDAKSRIVRLSRSSLAASPGVSICRVSSFAGS